MCEEERVQGLYQLIKWSDTWQMDFNKDKCHVLYMVKQNPRYKYTMGMGGVKLGPAEWEKDLGVIVSQSLLMSSLYVPEQPKRRMGYWDSSAGDVHRLLPDLRLPSPGIFHPGLEPLDRRGHGNVGGGQ